MSARTSRWILWGTAALLLPVPIWILGPGWVPAARIGMLGGISLAFMLLENSRGAVGPIAALLGLQAGVYLASYWLLAGLASRLLSRGSRRTVAGWTLAVVAIALVVSFSFDVYRDPFHGRLARSSALEVYE